ncbi:hypothetical protein [Litorilituus lipolyticus]|uniref:Lipoprotein n=1 Tax=Litorilituus lipolyticus TaxID=2491017 RepID=A0A502L4L2_9GAMM|nr:hypothetical protein [Litorilituus lipolyticus]TPH18104.1 hypothetical protein EPA86_03025 [Litorilituus lipolyticus]
MTIKPFILISLVVSLLSACSLRANESVAALLPENSSDARTEIVETVSKALGGKKVPIAQDVFQESSKLLLASASVTSPTGVKVISKQANQALVFELMKRGDSCLLKRPDTEQEWLLKTKLCIKK